MRERSVEISTLEGDAARLAEEGKTPTYVAKDGKAVALVAVAATVRDDFKAAIAALKRLGIEVVMIGTATDVGPVTVPRRAAVTDLGGRRDGVLIGHRGQQRQPP